MNFTKFERMFCELYDKEVTAQNGCISKCIGCQFAIADRSKSKLIEVHNSIKSKKRKRSVEVWQSVAASLSGLLQVVK
jgi:hypothetical protein